MCVSIVVPVLDEALAVPHAIDHLRRVAAQVVFVDGGSSDGTPDLIRAAGFRCIVAPRGRATQMNAGAAVATGSILMFLHADTRIPRHALAHVRRAVRHGAVGGNFGVRLDGERLPLRLIGRLISFRSRVTGVASGDQALFVTREAFDRLRGFAPMPLFEDLDFSRRLRRLGRVERLPLAVVTSARRWQRHGAIHTVLQMWGLRLLYYAGIDPVRLSRYYGVAR